MPGKTDRFVFRVVLIMTGFPGALSHSHRKETNKKCFAFSGQEEITFTSLKPFNKKAHE